MLNQKDLIYQEIGNVELVNINVRREGPFEGQITINKHNHHLTKCITKRTYGWICDLCRQTYKRNINSLYCVYVILIYVV